MALRLKNPKKGEWDYDGNCAPGQKEKTWNETFSVGVFQWLPTKSGLDLKRGKCIKRFRGSINNPQEVYDKAEEFIERNLRIAANA